MYDNFTVFASRLPTLQNATEKQAVDCIQPAQKMLYWRDLVNKVIEPSSGRLNAR